MPKPNKRLPVISGNVQKLLLDKKTQSLLRKRKDTAKLKASRKKAKDIVDKQRKKVEAKRKPNVVLALKNIETRKSEINKRLRAQVKASQKRTPQEVIDSFVSRLKVSALRNKKRDIISPARVIVRSRKHDDNAFALEIAGMFANGSLRKLKAMGIAVSKIPLKKSKLISFSICFPIEHYSVRKELLNLAWALRRMPAPFDSVAVSGLKGSLLSVEPSEARYAERSFSWHLDLTRVTRAHELDPPSGGLKLGEGIVIAHPDTGWAPHSQYNINNIDRARSHNIFEPSLTGNNKARHSIRNGDAGGTITHGTGTGSIILGGDPNDNKELWSTVTGPLEFTDYIPGPVYNRLYNGGRKITDRRGHLTGVAPKATVLPIKMIPDETDLESLQQGLGVIRLFDEDLIKAIRYAIDQQVHVISLSLGGLMHDEVRQILDEAILEHDIIVVAAAGQTFAENALTVASSVASLGDRLGSDDSVILPAAYQNVIAVAGCPPDGAPWKESHAGPNVDITAPADAVWKADFEQKDDNRSANATRRELLEAGSGTSFAASFMSGVAALWLAHWGRQNLINRYSSNGVPLAWVFRHQLQQTANAAHSNDWDDGRYGPGVVNVEALLNEPLPNPSSVEAPPEMTAGLIALVSAGGDVVLEVVDWLGDKADELRKKAAILIGFGRETAEKAIDELADTLAKIDAEIDQQSGQIKKDLENLRVKVVGEINDLVTDAEEFVDDSIDAAEEALDEVEEVVEDIIDAGGEAAEDVVEVLKKLWPF